MKFTLLAVDKLRDKNYRALAKDYASRIQRHGSVKTIEVKPSRADDDTERAKEESQALLKKAKSSSVLICLDENGKSRSSRGLAKEMDEDMLRGRSHWTLLIGGAGGHAPILRKKAQRVWSLSDLTLPHEMARVVVLEQLYRALSIIHNEPYHRD